MLKKKKVVIVNEQSSIQITHIYNVKAIMSLEYGK